MHGNLCGSRYACGFILIGVNVKYKYHDLANIFPMMPILDIHRLADDIKTNGLKNRIVLLDDKIIDGRNRYEACLLGKVEPAFCTYKGADPLAFVLSQNLHRRHLKESQRAMIAANIANMKSGARTDLPSANLHEVSILEAAKKLNVSRRIVADAKLLQREAPQMISKIESGELSISEVKTELKKREIKKQCEDIKNGKAVMPDGVYECIVVDPPWAYGTKYDADGRRVANPYPEMSHAELLDMKIPSADNSILFLWTTHRFIWDSKLLLDKYGFEYRSIIIWDKEKIGMGDLFRMQCEFCIVGIKGKPVLNNTNNIRDIIREARREHSRKPDAFYAMVEKLCVGRKLDIFARGKRDGWDVYGNDTEKFK